MAAKFGGRARSLRYGVTLCPMTNLRRQTDISQVGHRMSQGETTTKYEQFKNLEK